VPLLERAAFLASLAQDADEARAGDGRLVLLSGEAGVGKTALLEQLEAELPDAEWAWSACDGLFADRPEHTGEWHNQADLECLLCRRWAGCEDKTCNR